MNFEFLKPLDGINILYDSCCNAENFVRCDPDISCTEARKAMEYIIKLIYTTVVDREICGKTTFDMMTDFRFEDYVDDTQLMDAMHYIRKHGNQAVHGGGTTAEESMQALKYLHFAVGELCIMLGLIHEYPEFDDDFENKPAKKPASEEISFDPVAVLSFASGLSAVRHISEYHKIQNVHVTPKNARGTERGSGVDFGANTKTAFQIIAEGMSKQYGQENVVANYTKQILSYPAEDGRKVLAVKTGCSVLGNKKFDGTWEILPGIDYILYATDLNAENSVEDQLRIFTREQFLKMWEDLKLVRRKVSGSAKKRYQKIYGPDFKCNIEEHADVITVQSFTNSGKKYPMVLDACTKFPALSAVGYESLSLLCIL